MFLSDMISLYKQTHDCTWPCLFIFQAVHFFADMYNPKNNPFRVPMDNDIFTLRERERDAKLQVFKTTKKILTFYLPLYKTCPSF